MTESKWLAIVFIVGIVSILSGTAIVTWQGEVTKRVALQNGYEQAVLPGSMEARWVKVRP